jgi:hypothetical protein
MATSLDAVNKFLANPGQLKKVLAVVKGFRNGAVCVLLSPEPFFLMWCSAVD